MSALRATSMLRLARSATVSRASVSAVAATTPARCLSSLRTVATSPSTLAAARQPVLALAIQRRGYAASAGISQQEIQNRIFELLKSFEKVDPSAITAQASFTSDLGLDSLDAVEVVMAIEEEFNIEIPDAEADNITTVQQAIDYISKTPSAI